MGQAIPQIDLQEPSGQAYGGFGNAGENAFGTHDTIIEGQDVVASVAIEQVSIDVHQSVSWCFVVS